MGIFKNTEDAELAVNKLLPLLIRGVDSLKRVEVENFRHYSNDPDDTYYIDIIFYVDGESFNKELADKIYSIKHKILQDIKRYVGITLNSNSSSITTLK